MGSKALPSSRADLHPVDHKASVLSSHRYDIVCIGSGWAVRVAAANLVKAGLSVLIIEEELVGGDCPFWACVPSKVLLRPGEVLQMAMSVGGAKDSVIVGEKVDTEATFLRRDAFTGDLRDSVLLVPMVEEAGATIARGMGSIVDKKTIKITPHTGDAVEITADIAVILGVGSVPVLPPIPGIEKAKIWTPRDATSAQTIPQHLIVIGAGAVGTEMATAYASFGSRITLISSSSEILPSVDPEAGKVVREALQSRGVEVKVGARVVGLHRDEEGQVTVQLSNNDTITGSDALLATGRTGKHEKLGLDRVGAQTDGKWISVAEDLSVQTSDGESWLYAVGDVNGRSPLTHTSKYHGKIVSNAIIDRKRGISLANAAYSKHAASADHYASPQVIFSDPPVASVGFTRKTASEKGQRVREITAPFATLGGRIASDAAVQGWAQWLLDDEKRLVGATFVGLGAADVLHASTVAIVGGLTLDRLMHAIPSFPTISEVYLNLLDAAGI